MDVKAVAVPLVVVGAVGGVGYVLWNYFKREIEPGKGRIKAIVKDAATSDPIEGATVTANGVTETTGPDGIAKLDMDPGEYEVTVSKSGYETETRTEEVREGYETTMTVYMTEKGGPPPEYYTVSVKVKGPVYIHMPGGGYPDGGIPVPIDKHPLEGATVKLEGPRTYTMYTLENGEAHFSSVVGGSYRLSVERSDYRDFESSLEISEDGDWEVTMEAADGRPVIEGEWYYDPGEPSFYMKIIEAPKPGGRVRGQVMDVDHKIDEVYAYETTTKIPIRPGDPRIVHQYYNIWEPWVVDIFPIKGDGDWLQVAARGDNMWSHFIIKMYREDP